ncbi:MAG: ABC transporter permease [Caldisericota bacterium]|nr:ABC transporter permease [Caldisericota bacterium]
MDLRDSYRNATRAILAARMRSFLTMLGIVIGISAVILLLAVGEGSKRDILAQIQGSGSGNLFLTPGAQSSILSGPRATRDTGAKITMDDLKAIETKVTLPIVVSPANTIGIAVKSGTVTMAGSGVFATQTYFEVNNLQIASGRQLMASDVNNRTRNVVIGANVNTTLFPGGSALGKLIRIKGMSFRVVGIAASKGQSFMGNADNSVILPLTVGEKSFGMPHDTITMTTIKSVNPDDSALVARQITDVLTRLHHKTDFSVLDQKSLTTLFSSAMDIFTTLLAAIGALSLLVGGIGIMNIMLVSVTERTREIGIRKALGARERDILTQFLIESSLLSGIGGVLGVLLSVLSSNLIIKRFLPTAVTTSSVILAVGFSIAVGVFFGVYPARKAARLKPVEALRYE